jgi:hypothetical protein
VFASHCERMRYIGMLGNASDTSNVVLATWGLVLVTFLLVLASTVPALIERRREKERTAASLIPDMHMLRSRLEGTVDVLIDPEMVGEDVLEDQLSRVDTDLELLGGILRVRGYTSLEFANELYVVRHLLTHAGERLSDALALIEEHDEESVRRRDAAVSQACREYIAARISLGAAEGLLPKWARTIDGEAFWDRFIRVATRREREAEKLQVDFRRLGPRPGGWLHSR